MNKFTKLIIILVVIALGPTVYFVGKKGGGKTEVSPNGESTDGSSGVSKTDSEKSEGSDKSGGSQDKVAVKGGGEDGNSDDFMGGVTGKSAGGTAGNAGGAGGSQDQNAVPREGDTSKTAGAGGAGGMPGVGVPGVGAPGAGSMPGAGGVAGTTQNKPDSNCFSFEYKHQKEALNKDIEDFLDYSNAFPILHKKVVEKSICVKVNGKAVAHKVSKYKDQQEIVIGSVVGPESVIKVSYCTNGVTCKEACAVKTNRFMDDLMSDTGDEDEFKESWGEAKEQKKELTAKVKEFRSVASENRDLQKQSTIRTWDTVNTNEWVCKK